MEAMKLPLELLSEEILLRLPAKSLLRFKCVSTFFKTLISTPDFIHRHISRSLSSDANRLLVVVARNGVVCTNRLDLPESPSLCVSLPGCSDEGYGSFLVGSCNGLICVGLSFSSLAIFNPSTGIYKLIYCKYASSDKINFGFGFDDVNDDYRLVRVTNEVEVYSLKSDSWRWVGRISSKDSIKGKDSGALINNHLIHWKFCCQENRDYRIGCFNVKNNQWSDDVSLPDLFRSSSIDLLHLGVLDGCLCLLTKNESSIREDVWLMKEYGVKDSWMKLTNLSYVENHPPMAISPIVFAKEPRSEIMVCNNSHSKIFWYDIREKTWRWTNIHQFSFYHQSTVCRESLVNIPDGIRSHIWGHRRVGQHDIIQGFYFWNM